MKNESPQKLLKDWEQLGELREEKMAQNDSLANGSKPHVVNILTDSNLKRFKNYVDRGLNSDFREQIRGYESWVYV